jgi:hypothetical protein
MITKAEAERIATEFQGRTVQVHRTSLTDDGGTRIECADGPLWVTYARHGLG